MPLALRVDSKGRVVIPKSVRQQLHINPGDTFFLESEGNVIRLAKAENPFDALARHAVQEYRAGRTRSLLDT
jgi:antitoxin PrlF